MSTPDDEIPLLETEDFFADRDEATDVVDAMSFDAVVDLLATHQRTPQQLPEGLLDMLQPPVGSPDNPTQQLVNHLAAMPHPAVHAALEAGLDPNEIAVVLKAHGLDF